MERIEARNTTAAYNIYADLCEGLFIIGGLI